MTHIDLPPREFAIRAASCQLVHTDITRQGLRDVVSQLEVVAQTFRWAYAAIESPADQWGNPTDYHGDAHQAKLRAGDYADELQTAADVIRRILNRGEIGD